VAAFAPDEGEALRDIEADSKDSVLNSALVPLRYPTDEGDATETEFAINAEKFHDALAADVSPEQARIMAATQRPISALGFSQRTRSPAWRSLPSWAVIPTGDVLRRMAERTGATIVEADGSHVIMISQPKIVTDVVRQALRKVTR